MVFLVQAGRKEEEGKEEQGGTFLLFLPWWVSVQGPSRDAEGLDPNQTSLASNLAGVHPNTVW